MHGTEPFGVDAMFCNVCSGRTDRLERVGTVADSLRARRTMPCGLAVSRQFVDEVVRVTGSCVPGVTAPALQ